MSAASPPKGPSNLIVELRRHPRVPLDVSVTFGTEGSMSRTEGRTKDISVGGAFIMTNKPAPFGADVLVTITLPDSDGPMKFAGVVRWIGNGGMGVQFGSLGAKETFAITEYTKKYEF